MPQRSGKLQPLMSHGRTFKAASGARSKYPSELSVPVSLPWLRWLPNRCVLSDRGSITIRRGAVGRIPGMRMPFDWLLALKKAVSGRTSRPRRRLSSITRKHSELPLRARRNLVGFELITKSPSPITTSIAAREGLGPSSVYNMFDNDWEEWDRDSTYMVVFHSFDVRMTSMRQSL